MRLLSTSTLIYLYLLLLVTTKLLYIWSEPQTGSHLLRHARTNNISKQSWAVSFELIYMITDLVTGVRQGVTNDGGTDEKL